MPSLQESLNQAPPWLKEAHRHSTAQWLPYILPLESLQPFRIDENEGGYQRPISPSRVQDLVDKFDAGEARDIYVSERSDGSRWILDGQHTWAALQQVGITHWSCRVFFNLTVAEEANRFAEYQSNTRRIPPVVQFNAEVIGGSPVAKALDRILDSFYLRISSSKLRSRDGYLPVTSRAVFQKLYELGGENLLREVIQVSIDAWGHRKDSFRERVLQGLGYLLAWTQGEYDRGRFVAVLKNTQPKAIMDAIGPTGPGGAARSGAIHLHSLYMEGMPGYPQVRKNAKEAPRLVEQASKDGPEPHEFWTEESASQGRTAVGPVVKETLVEEEAKGAPLAEEVPSDAISDVTEETVTDGNSSATESDVADEVTEASESFEASNEEFVTQSGDETTEDSLSEEDGWEYPEAADRG